MQNWSEIRNRANRHFFIKMTFNIVLIILSAVIISLFLRHIQYQTSLSKQQQESELALTEAATFFEENVSNNKTLSSLYHNGNQDILNDLRAFLTGTIAESLSSSGIEDRSRLFRELADRSDVDYLLLLGTDGRIFASSNSDYNHKNFADLGLLSSENSARLLEGTRTADGGVSPVAEGSEDDRVFFYSITGRYDGKDYVLALGLHAGAREHDIDTLMNIGQVLSRISVANDGFIFAVDAADGSFLYYQNGAEVLTGENAFEAGLSRDALQDGYNDEETINGTEYYCVSKVLEDGTVICAVAETDNVFRNARHVLNWTIATFLLVMFLCLTYAVIVRNDYIRNAVDTKRIILYRWFGSPVILDISIFRKVFPLMIMGVLVIFGISYYSQTLLAISQTARKSAVALDEVFDRYQYGVDRRVLIQEGHDNRYLDKARLIAYMLEDDPSVLNEPSEREYSYFDDEGIRRYRLDDEGNRLRSVSSSARLQELCQMNSLDSLFIYDENGRTIATSTENWYFIISHDPESQSYPFLEVLEGKKDVYIQDYQTDEFGENFQYIGVAFHYYTTLDEHGRTVYVSRREYEDQAAGDNQHPITAHRSLLQIGMTSDLRVLTATKTEFLLASNNLIDGSFLMFDNSADHICLYSDYDENIGMKAEDMGISQNAFTPGEYYGFPRVNGEVSFLYSRYEGNNHIATLIPRSTMYQSRTQIALNTTLISLLVILLLSVTVTLTTEEEEMLYATINDDTESRGLNSTILKVILPYGQKPPKAEFTSRWNKRWIPWWQSTPEQKLNRMIDIFCIAILLYIVIAVVSADTIFPEHSVILYILSRNWDRGLNIFAMSSCVLMLISMRILVTLLRIPLLSVSNLLGTRSETIGNLLLSVVKYGGVIAALFFCLYLLGMDPASLLASAGVLSLIIGFGAQSLIKDILAGIFFVFDGEFRIGDIVTIDSSRGTVMDIGLRTTKILMPGGNIKVYNNSEISGVLNMTKESSMTFCQISIEYGQDIDYVEAVLRRELPKLREKNPDLLSDPVCLGVQTLGDSGVDILVQAESSEQNIKSVTRFMNKELLKIFYSNGIQVPFPNVTISTLDTEGRKTMADFEDVSQDVSSWWDSAGNRTRSITVTSHGVGMEDALQVTEQLAVFRSLDHRSTLQLRLLTEELFGLLRGIAGDVIASYWIVVIEDLYELHMRTQLRMTRELREQLLGVSTSGENTAAKGFMGGLLDMVFTRLLKSTGDLNSGGTIQESPDPDADTGEGTAEEWTMSRYKSDIDHRRDQSADAAEKWDELEKSIVARLANDVKVSMRGVNVEITIIKSFPKD